MTFSAEQMELICEKLAVISESINALVQVVKQANQPPESEIPKKRKKKDPNAPKNPIGSFLLFQSAMRKDILEQYPNLTPTEVPQKIGELWRALPAEEKRPYEEKAKELREIYQLQLAEYKEKLNHPKSEEESEEEEDSEEDLKKIKMEESEEESEDEIMMPSPVIAKPISKPVEKPVTKVAKSIKKEASKENSSPVKAEKKEKKSKKESTPAKTVEKTVESVSKPKKKKVLKEMSSA